MIFVNSCNRIYRIKPNSRVENPSKVVNKVDVLHTEDQDKNRAELSQDGLNAQTALHILVRYLLGENWYIADPVGGKQANSIIVDTILKQYSSKYRKELRQEKNLENYANRLSAKLERKKNKMKRRKSK